jgi:PIN domain nuclease of toxin-antitoxin system
MRYLLDTHTLLWYFDDSAKLPDSVAEIIENADTQKFVSIASMWEFAIKHNLGKLRFEGGISTFWDMISANGVSIFQIGEQHLAGLGRLPFLHRDPFDRLLIATAIAENMTILSADENIHQYDVRWAW